MTCPDRPRLAPVCSTSRGSRYRQPAISDTYRSAVCLTTLEHVSQRLDEQNHEDLPKGFEY